MSDINTTESRELFAKTTQGEWSSRRDEDLVYDDDDEDSFQSEIGDGVNVDGTAVCVAWCERENAKWIAFAHNNWPAIFDTIERQAREIERLTALVSEIEANQAAEYDSLNGTIGS